jgi:transposase-like protein
VNESNEVPTEPSLERRTRRQFSGAEKRRLLAEHDELPRGEKGAWLRRQGLYAGQLAVWRKTLAEDGTRGLEPSAGGRKPRDPRDRRIEALERERQRLEHRARVAEDLVDLQKKFFALIEDAQSGSSR